MLNDFTWNMTGYIPKHAVNPNGDGIIPYVAERIFQLEPEPPAVGSLNEYILSASKAEEIFLVQLQARIPVVVERAASHAVAAHFQPVVFGGLFYADCRLDGFIDCHRKTSVHSIQKARNIRRDWQVFRSFYYGYDRFFKKQANRRTTPFQKTGQLSTGCRFLHICMV